MKVQFLTTGAKVGGLERLSALLAGGGVARGWRVENVYPRSHDYPALLEWCVAQGIPATASSALLEITEPHTYGGMRALWMLVRRSNADVVSLHYGGNFISLKDVVAVRLAGARRCIVTVCHPGSWDRRNARKRMMTAVAGHLAHRVVAISQATRGALRDAGVRDSQIVVIPCGLPPPAELPSRAQARQRLNLAPEAFVISTLARLVSSKRIDRLIDAVGQMTDSRQDIVLIVGGDGPERAALETQAARRLGARARFLGRVPATDDLYAASDVFALPSWLEGFGLVYVEAAFHGVPSIGSGSGGTPEVIVDGETGLLVTPDDPAALFAALQRLHDDPALRATLGSAARIRAHQEFTLSRMVERYERIFHGVA